MILSVKIPQQGREKNFKFYYELQKDKSLQTFTPAVHLERWATHFEHEYIIKPSKNLIEP